MAKLNWTNLLANTCFSLNYLLLFLAGVGTNMHVPTALQITGRMHPLVLHFPIVLLIVSVIWELFAHSKKDLLYRQVGDVLLLSTAITAVLTALFGLFLSKEGGYEAEALRWHLWGGVMVSVLAGMWYSYRNWVRQSLNTSRIMGGIALAAVFFTGHKGANITHGEGYLTAPIAPQKEQAQVPFEQAMVYADLVRPILKEKCMTCHNNSKSKGELVMETEAQLLKGGKNGVLWDTAATDLGLMLHRAHLPIDEKEHMPPKGKPQLSDEDIQIMTLWIKKGASFKQKLIELPENDPLRLLAASRFKSNVVETYPFAAANETSIKRLNNDYRSVKPLDTHSPALAVSYFGIASFNSASLADLKTIKEQVVRLNLSKMPVKDEDMKQIAALPNLRHLNLSFTQITGAALQDIKALRHLEKLALAGVFLTAKDLEVLRDLPQLSMVYLWETGVTKAEIANLQKNMPNIGFESGYQSDSIPAQLNAPVIKGDEQLFTQTLKVKLKNYIKGAVVRYTLDGTTPDSLTSPIGDQDSIVINTSCLLTAKTFLPGWVSSDVATRSYYKIEHVPDSVSLTFSPNPQYVGEGAKTLANKKVGDMDFRSNKWLGFKETPLESFLYFKKQVTLSSVTISTLVDIGSYIMPAERIEIWGGTNKKNLVLLKKLVPEQPKTGALPQKQGFTCTFEPQEISIIKVVAKSVGKLPGWHPGKGTPGWVFVDEIFLN